MDRTEKESLGRKEQWYTRAEESCSLSEEWGCLDLSGAPGIRLRQQGRLWGVDRQPTCKPGRLWLFFVMS